MERQHIFSPEKLEHYYRNHRFHELKFDDTTIQSIGLIEREIFLTVDDVRLPCRLKTATMIGAEVRASLSKSSLEQLSQAGEVRINLSFAGLKALLIPVSFSIPCAVEKIRKSADTSTGVYTVVLTNIHKAPGYVIGTFGEYISSKSEESLRRHERISINAESAAALGLKSQETHILLGESKRECSVRDISFSGSKVAVYGPADNKPKRGALDIFFKNPDGFFRIPGRIVRYTPTSGIRAGFFAAIQFDSSSVPEEYKRRVQSLFETA